MEQKRKVIGKTTYLVTQMGAIDALKVQTKLIKILGPGALAMLDSSSDIQSKLTTLIPKLMENFDDDLVNGLVMSLFDKGVFTEVSGYPKVVDFDTHFVGKAGEMWRVLAFILEANFDMGELLGSSLHTTQPEQGPKEG